MKSKHAKRKSQQIERHYALWARLADEFKTIDKQQNTEYQMEIYTDGRKEETGIDSRDCHLHRQTFNASTTVQT